MVLLTQPLNGDCRDQSSHRNARCHRRFDFSFGLRVGLPGRIQVRLDPRKQSLSD